MRLLFFAAIVVGVCLGMHASAASDEVMICDFETKQQVGIFEVNTGSTRLVSEGVVRGERALEITFDPKGKYGAAYMTTGRMPQDWSAHDALVLHVTNPGKEPIPATLLIADQAWVDHGRTYWNRHNAGKTFPPGASRWVIPVQGLYRGEAGSRDNDIKRNIDADAIVRLDFGFGRPGRTGRVIVDAVMLIRSGRPAGVWSFDFGPPSQPVMPGWTAIAHDTRYTAETGFGWGPSGGTPWQGAARDTTFGPPLIRDFCEAGGCQFRVGVPPGKYRVTIIYENSGYWGGEQARHRRRSIEVNGAEAWSESRPAGGAHALYRFEDVEPVGVDLWDTYMAPELARSVTLSADCQEAGLTLRFHADTTWGSKVAALLIVGEDDRDGLEWAEGQLADVAREFRALAVCLDLPADPAGVAEDRPQAAASAWAMCIEEEFGPQTLAPSDAPAPGRLKLEAVAVRGEQELLCLAVRPRRDLGEVTLKASVLEDGHGGRLSTTAAVVWYGTSRAFNSIAFRTVPHTLRPAAAVALPADVTRVVVVRVRVPSEASSGRYRGVLTVGDALTVPLEVTVLPVSLDRETDFLMGFFGLMPPALIPPEASWEVLEETLVLLRDYGMNAVSGGPNWRLVEWRDGEPTIEFGEMDRFVALLRKHGFTRSLNGYGGARFHGLHTGYEKGRDGAIAERESGFEYEEAVLRAWAAVDRHARAMEWPTVLYAMCDETRVRDRAERELVFMRLMGRVSKAFPRTVRSSGSYSVHFRSRPDDVDEMLHWHQRFFEALEISSLNSHDASVLKEARAQAKEVHIYNQGRSRYSFGLYQWSEYRKGVKARWQWHLNILHGYQFFDLDGREPDTAMVCYGREGIYPTIHFERCREGAEDFYLYNRLWKLAEGKASVSAEARQFLHSRVDDIALNQRQAPRDYDPRAIKLRVARAIASLR